MGLNTQVLPRAMKCVAAPMPGGPERAVLFDRDLPKPSAGEVLVRVAAAGVSRPDILQRQGLYPPPANATDILGLEVSGTIVALGAGVNGWSRGDRVCALVSGGGYSEYCAVPQQQLLPVPDGISLLDAASLPENMCTVWDNLFTRGRLRAGEKVLVHGGTSGIGSTAIALANAFGAKVIATAGTDEKVDVCIRIGAHTAVNYRSFDFGPIVDYWTGGSGVDVVVDIVGSSYMQRNLDALALDGRLIVLAALGETDATVDLWQLLQRRLSVIASSMRARSVAQKGAIVAALREQVWPLLEQKKVVPLIDRVYPLERVAEAHARLESSGHIGKIVLQVINDQ